MKILGIDYGEKRIGLAISDQLNMFAHPLDVVENKGVKSNMEVIKKVIEENKIDKIVIGFPLNMNGTEGERCEKTNQFIVHLKKFFQGDIIKWDERLTTVAATKMLLEHDMSRAKRKKVVDKIAACYILQGYMDSTK